MTTHTGERSRYPWRIAVACAVLIVVAVQSAHADPKAAQRSVESVRQIRQLADLLRGQADQLAELLGRLRATRA